MPTCSWTSEGIKTCRLKAVSKVLYGDGEKKMLHKDVGKKSDVDEGNRSLKKYLKIVV